MPQPRPHLLFIAYHFPPHRTVACHRTRNLAKHLALLAWKVTVLTLAESVWQRVDDTISDSRDIDKDALRLLRVRPRLRWLNTDQWRQSSPNLAWWTAAPFRRLCRFLDIELSLGWIPSALRAVQSLDTDEPQIILATGGPFLSSFYLANRLARRWNVSYVLDYRDLWTTGNPHGAPQLMRWQRILERRCAHEASALVTVSPGLAENLRQQLDLPNQPLVITNGYDLDLLAAVQPAAFPEPAIVYAGTLYPPLRTLDPLLTALRLLDLPGLRWRLHYYGLQAQLVQSSAQRHLSAHRVICHGDVPWATAAAALKGAACAVVVISVLRKSRGTESGILTGKLFELLGLGARILLIAPEDAEARRLLGPPHAAVHGEDPAAIAAALRDMLLKPSSPAVPPPQYAWPNLALTWNRLLRNLLPA